MKTRLGYSSTAEWREWLTTLLEQDIVTLTVHLRTKKEMSKVPAHWEIMPEIIRLRDEIAPHTLIVGNGDVQDYAHGVELVEQYGCDGIMIGRGVFANPFAFSKDQGLRAKDALLDLLRYHLDLYDQYAPQTMRPFDTLKRFFKIYVRDFDGASELRERLMHTTSTDEVRNIIDEI